METSLVLLSFLGLAAYYDARTGLIPNWLVMGGALVAFLLSAALSLQTDEAFSARLIWQSLTTPLLGAIACGIVPLLLYRLQALGGGDVKLMAMAGSFIGLTLGLQLLVYSLLIAALAGVAKVAIGKHLGRSASTVMRIARNGVRAPTRRQPVDTSALTVMRFGPSVFVAGCLLTLETWSEAASW